MSKRRAHYCVRIANAICEQIALGNSLTKALEKVGHLAPSMPMFWRWLDEYPEFLEKYERARQMQADIHADRMLDMATDVIKTPSKAGAIRVAVDILKWQAEIRNPKQYGTKVQHEHKPAAMKPDDIKKEIAKLENELGVKATPAMNTAPRQLKANTIDVETVEVKNVEPAFVESEESDTISFPAPPPNSELDPANAWVHAVMSPKEVLQ